MRTHLQNQKSELFTASAANLFTPARIIFEKSTSAPSNAPSDNPEKAPEGQEVAPEKPKGPKQVEVALARREARSEAQGLKAHGPKPGETGEKPKTPENLQKPPAQAEIPGQAKPEVPGQTQTPKSGAEAQEAQLKAPQDNIDAGFNEFKQSTTGSILGFFMQEEDLKKAYKGEGFFGAILGVLGIGVGSKAVAALEKNPKAKGVMDQIRGFINDFTKLLGFELFPTYEKLAQADFAKYTESKIMTQNCEIFGAVTLAPGMRIVLHNDGKEAPTLTAAADSPIQIEIGGEKKPLEKGKSITPEQGKDVVIASGSVIPSGAKLSKGFKVEVASSTVTGTVAGKKEVEPQQAQS